MAGLALSAAASPLAGCRTRDSLVVGYLDRGSPGDRQVELEAFKAELAELMRDEEVGYTVEPRFGGDLKPHAEGLAAMKAAVIVAFGTDATAAVADCATPVVMASSSDPLGSGFAASLERPGGCITGLTSLAPQLTGRRLQLLREAFPRVTRAGFLRSDSPGDDQEEAEFRGAASRLGILPLVESAGRMPVEVAISRLAGRGAEALLAAASAFISSNRRIVVQAVGSHNLPAMYGQRELVADAGGLMAYGPDYVDMYRRAAGYVYKILKGASPALLPIETPRRFSLVVSRSAVQQLGLTLSRGLLAQVDEVL
jgi:putative ABC transport system substrate-binding protein